MKLHEIQKTARDCLAANAFFSGVEILLEADPQEADPKKLAELADRFERALGEEGQGLAIVVLSPFTSRLGLVKQGALSMRVFVPVAIAENPERNRAAGGFGKSALEVLEEALATLLPKFEIGDRPFGRPELANGLSLYYLAAETTRTIRAKS